MKKEGKEGMKKEGKEGERMGLRMGKREGGLGRKKFTKQPVPDNMEHIGIAQEK